MCNATELDDIAGAPEVRGRAGRLVARIGPQTKLCILCAGLMLNLVWSSAVSPVLLAVACLALLAAIGIAPGKLARRLVVPWYIAFVAVATQLFLAGGTPLFQAGPLTAYADGLARGALLGGRIVGGTALVLAFSLTSSVTELLALASWLKLPPVLVEIATLSYRYVFLLAEEGQRIREAQVARLGHSTWRRSMQSYGVLIGMVMVRCFDRAEGVYLAMTVRGYRGALPAVVCKRIEADDLRAVAIALVVLALAFWVGNAYGV